MGNLLECLDLKTKTGRRGGSKEVTFEKEKYIALNVTEGLHKKSCILCKVNKILALDLDSLSSEKTYKTLICVLFTYYKLSNASFT